jgi:PPE family
VQHRGLVGVGVPALDGISGSPLRAPVAAPMKLSTALRQHARNPRAYLGTTCHAQSVLRQQTGAVSFDPFLNLSGFPCVHLLKEKPMSSSTTRNATFEIFGATTCVADQAAGLADSHEIATDFGGSPPEINSERMYSGPGSGPMSAAAAAWDGLACRLFDVAAGYRSVTARLEDGWHGPTATAMIQAAKPHIGWMNANAVTPVTSAMRLR